MKHKTVLKYNISPIYAGILLCMNVFNRLQSTGPGLNGFVCLHESLYFRGTQPKDFTIADQRCLADKHPSAKPEAAFANQPEVRAKWVSSLLFF